MGAAIWSCPASTMLDFPARSFIRFMNNHRLLHYSGRPVWRTVAGGSRSYVEKITDQLDFVETGTTITGLRREAGGVILSIAGEGDVWFDRVVLAAHADQSLQMISDASDLERNLLSSFRFQPNRVLLHSDPSFMPKKRSCWASWNYLSADVQDAGLCVTYWMNKLQSIPDDTPLFVTLNPFSEPDPALLHREFSYDHPVFDQPALRAQKDLASIQGHHGLFFCGAWTRNGFHEDGLSSATAMARTLGVTIPWNSPTEAWPVLADADPPLSAAQPGAATAPGLTGLVGA
jgi:predicted NAD/FAD-binding protein